MDKRILSNLGIDEKTEKVYRSLLRLGDATASSVAKVASLKRTSVYHTLENLVGMGVVSTYVSRGIKRYSAENPLTIKQFFEQKAIIAEKLLPLLMKEVNMSSGKIKINIFEGVDGIKTSSEKALESKNKIIYSIGSSKKLINYLGGSFGLGFRRRKKGIYMKSLRFVSDETDTRKERMQEAKFMSEDYDFPGYILFFDATVIIIFYNNGGRAISIESKEFYRMIKTFFDIFWAVLN